eukprot:GAHX01002643.1.p1 GENE.GAHX01002643.1~~GAHX01002643.1.p1  ORF type:complete len:282 (+),score=35.23 GAHX01002643.1:82-927(+)
MKRNDTITFSLHILLITVVYPAPITINLYFKNYSVENSAISSLINFIIFSIFYTLILVSFYFVHKYTSASSECQSWLESPKNSQLFTLLTKFNANEECLKCGNRRPYRTHHCSRCEECILVMDHHCPWMGTCIGLFNKKAFILFSLYSFLLSFMNVIICSNTLVGFKHFTNEINVTPLTESRIFVSLVLLCLTSVATMLTAGCFFCFNFFLGVMNSTLIERKIDFRQKILNQKEDEVPFMENIFEVFGKRKLYWLIPKLTENDKIFVMKRCLDKEHENLKE